jgi:hypothetical protein
MINSAVARLPDDWQYMAWVDADITFLRPDWVQETIQQLQHHAVVQMFEYAVDLPQDGYYYTKTMSFHPGFAWACRREAWEKLGGLLDINIRRRFTGLPHAALRAGGQTGRRAGDDLLSGDAAQLPSGPILHVEKQRHQASLLSDGQIEPRRYTRSGLEAESRQHRTGGGAVGRGGGPGS